MNKRGQVNYGWIVLGIIAIVGLILAIGILTGGFKLGWDSLKEALGIPSKHLEAFNVTVPEIEEIKTETETMEQLLTDAAENVKKGLYDTAVKKYILYYDACEKEFVPPEGYEGVAAGKWLAPTCRKTTREGTKFRILNALRDKYFMLVKKGETPAPENDIKTLNPNLIIRSELDSIVALVSISAYTNKNDYPNALIYENTYRENYQDMDEDKFNQLYSNAIVQRYRIIKEKEVKSETLLCVDTLGFLNEIEVFTNNYFKDAFEGYKGKTILTASNYKFISIPSEEIKGICRS